MKSYNTILFDLDGTLINSSQGIFNSLYYTFDKEGIEYASLDLMPILGPPIDDGLKQLLPELFQDDKYLKHVITIFRDHYKAEGVKQCEVYDGIADLLRELHASEKKLIIATSKPTSLAESTMRTFQLDHYFHLIVGSNLDLTRTIKSEIISHVLSQLTQHDKSQMVMIGDRRHDMEGAKHHGIDAIGVTYGYGSAEELQAYHPVHLTPSVSALKKILL